MKNKKNRFIQQYLKDVTPSDIPHLVIEETVKEILKIAQLELKKDPQELAVLDVGSGWGEYSFELEKYVKRVVGVEPFTKNYNFAVKSKQKRKSQVEFHNLLIENFSTQQQFDLILSITTIEHMPQVENSFNRIFSLLKPGGMIYVTAPNKWWPIEQHYGIWFLGWLPLPLSNMYLKILHKGTSFADCSYAKSYFGMKKLFDKFKCKYYFFVPSPEAAYLGCGGQNKVSKFIRSAGIWLIQKSELFYALSKGFIMVVKTPE